MKRSERYRQYAESARKRAKAAHDKADATFDRIPMGQPIITGRGSRTTADINRRERAFRNIGKAADEYAKAEAWEHSADRREHYEQRLEDAQKVGPLLEGVNVGDEVIACFTNSGRDHRFRGRIVRRTVNEWKVQTLDDTAPYGEPPGRVFSIPAAGRPRFSARNRVYKIEEGTNVQR